MSMQPTPGTAPDSASGGRRVAVITGASSGIGEALARQLLSLIHI